MSASAEYREITDRLDPARAAALHAALALPGEAPGPGAPLPPFWHWIQFWEAFPPEALGRDGHPRPGLVLPDTGLPRRMWAGGRLSWHAPLPIGEEVRRRSHVLSVTSRTGRSGPLAFVTMRHEILGPHGHAVTEDQEIVYRTDPRPGAPAPQPVPAPRGEAECEEHRFDSVALFRYSALTFNGHRIHYDIDYCREVEGYPGLVVHGPLLAQLLIRMADRMLPRLARFSFRATAPVFHDETFETCARPEGDGLSLWVRGADGRLAMSATASPTPGDAE
ncbi:MaoC family dehydratase N-terminal domain-containing protein [Oceanicella sp. SM1341]|uniref:FAS1-like dehydratase domain-containing protein n=1 Tax=Oceanicella sp. SM1341 TaxID=1548889 RepID=UPI000E5303A7|nr:MaoC family dehydratase N-terminal domain-containing protein [Oceanicella sp. SM1341]